MPEKKSSFLQDQNTIQTSFSIVFELLVMEVVVKCYFFVCISLILKALKLIPFMVGRAYRQTHIP